MMNERMNERMNRNWAILIKSQSEAFIFTIFFLSSLFLISYFVFVFVARIRVDVVICSKIAHERKLLGYT